MNWYGLRPSFQIPLAESYPSALQKLTTYYRQQNQDPLFHMNEDYGELRLPPEEYRIWSPYLSFYLHQSEGRDCIVCRFAPRPHIWTFVWAVYLMMTCSIFFSLMFAYAQWMLDQTPWTLIITIIAAVVILTINIIAGIGQSWSVDQINFLHEKFNRIISAAQIQVKAEE